MNDCKYGYDIKGNVMRLSLLRAPESPDPGADKCKHEFVYAVYPHTGDWRTANTVRRGYELNQPLQVIPAAAGEGNLPQAASFVDLNARHVVLDAMKPSEDKQGVVIRLYESAGGRERVKLKFRAVLRQVQETNLLEEQVRPVGFSGNCIELDLLPYEVKTVKIIFG